MTRSMRIQVLTEPELLTKTKLYATEHKILHKNDSQLIRNVLMKGITDLSDMELTIYILRGSAEDRKKEIASLVSQNDGLSKQNQDFLKEIEILKTNLEKKTKKKVKK